MRFFFLKITIITLILFPIISFSHEVEILGMAEAPLDLTASTYQRKDLNGTPCALVKVIITNENVKFEGNIIGDIEFKTNEYWVYLSNGTKCLKVKIPGLNPIMVNFLDYGINSLSSKQTYELTFQNLTNSREIQSMQKFVLKVSPKDVKIKIDDIDCEYENGSLTTILPIGTHNYELSYNNQTLRNNFTLFSSQPLELVLDLNSRESNYNTIEGNYSSEEEMLYYEALKCIKLGDEPQAELLANRGLAKGYNILTEIFQYLILCGYYDEDLDKMQIIETKIEQLKKQN